MFHDQGHIPVELLGFNVDPATGKWQAISGVNITLGLPILRTSVDHGTAFDIAGQGIADISICFSRLASRSGRLALVGNDSSAVLATERRVSLYDESEDDDAPAAPAQPRGRRRLQHDQRTGEAAQSRVLLSLDSANER